MGELDSGKSEEVLEKREFMKNKTVGTLEQSKDRMSRNVLEYPGEESL